jgi:hypothetical protein
MTPAPTTGSGAERRSGYRVPLARPRPVRVAPEQVVKRGTSSGWSLLGALLILVALTLYALGEWMWDQHTGSGLIAAPVLIVITFFALHRRIDEERSFDLGGILLTSVGLHAVLAYPRFVTARDAVTYNREGARLALSFRQLDFTNVSVGTGAPVPGTGVLRYLAGLAHLLTGSNFFASFLLFAFLSFAGCWMFYRAFVIAVPDGDHRRYAMLLFLWPSLLFWPSSLGKDSWMVFTGGIAVLGAARLFSRERGGYVLLAMGLGLAALVRPHVSLLLFAAVAVGFLVGRRDSRRIPGQFSLAGVTKVVGIAVLVVAGSVLAPATARFLKVDQLNPDGVTSVITDTQARTSDGNSAFKPVNPNSPLGYPEAVVTVLFRPLPGEVSGLAGLATSTEGLALFGLAAVGWRRVWTALRRLRSSPYVTMTTAYIAMFAYAFAAIANFGVLTRERVQVLPLMFVVLALPPSRRVTDDSGRVTTQTVSVGAGEGQ